MPALGMAAMGRVVALRIASTAVRTVAGPVEQFTPMAFGAPLGEQRRGLLRRRAVEAIAVVVDRDHDEHGQFGRGFLRRGQRLASFVQSRHGFDDEHVDAGGHQGADLFDECSAGLVEPGLAQRLEAHAQRSDRAGHPGFAGLLVLEMGHGLLRQLDAGGIDLGHLAGQSMARQAESIGAEGVGFENFRAGLQIVFVDGKNQVGVGKIQLVVAAVDEDAARVKHGAHGAVGKNRPAAEDVGKAWHSLAIVSH